MGAAVSTTWVHTTVSASGGTNWSEAGNAKTLMNVPWTEVSASPTAFVRTNGARTSVSAITVTSSQTIDTTVSLFEW